MARCASRLTGRVALVRPSLTLCTPLKTPARMQLATPCRQTRRSYFEGISADAEFTSKIKFQKTADPIPILRYVDEKGKLTPGTELPFSLDTLVEMYKTMVKSAQIDKVLNSLQRQGRISFYMTNTGEEAASVGSAAALHSDDVVWPQYRELGAFLQRGFTIQQVVDQCMSRGSDAGKGRQMPIHYVDANLNMQAVTSPLGTQIPQAAGAGYAFRVAGESRCAATYFGDGAASEGDFAVALNFAATLKAQTIFLCRNNGWAISTPVKDQYAGDGIAIRGIAYGLSCIRADGNDLIAVYIATQQARKLCVETGMPVIVEFMTYRREHHSTSDDSTRYRGGTEPKSWGRQGVEPISRMRLLLEDNGQWDEARDQELIQSHRTEVMEAMRTAESMKFAPIAEMFADVFATETPQLRRQKEELFAHLEKHADTLDVSKYAKS